MKKKKVNEILVNQAKRRNIIFSSLCAIFLILAVSFSFLLIYTKKNQPDYVTYSENSNVNYQVHLKENDFFDKNYLEANKQYIAQLIDYINANFEYKMSLEEKEIEYKYNYRIEANVSVKQKQTENLLFNKVETILDEKEVSSTSKDAIIKEEITINYNYYNDLINRFINTYRLDDVESVLTINMYVNIVGACEDFVKTEEKDAVISLSIPLTTKTIAIDIGSNLTNSQNNVMQCKNLDSNSIIFLIIGTTLSIIDLFLIVKTFKYIIRTRTAESIYERELKKILYNYGSYIQTFNNDFNLRAYQAIKIDSFTDMLEIRDTIRQPILFKENNDRTGAYFLIPSYTRILYVYTLKVSDIKKNMTEKEEI